MDKLHIKRLESARIPTDMGEFQLYSYSNTQDNKNHLALVMGDVLGQRDVLVRIHSECYTGDVLGSKRCDCGEQLHRAMQMIAEVGAGVIIYLRQEGRGIGLIEKLRAYNLQDQGYDTVEANLLLGHQADARDYTIAVRILEDLHINSVQLITNNPQKINSLKAMGISVKARIGLYGSVNNENAKYLQTKIERMKHYPFQDNNAKIKPIIPTNQFAILKHIFERLAQAPQFSQQKRRPYITLSYAQTLDGSIALRADQQLNISNTQAHTLTHHLRARHDAILVGINTVLADNPQLTVRLVEGDNPQPIILDSQLRCPLDANLVQNSKKRPLWIMSSKKANKKRQIALEAMGTQVFRLNTDADGKVNLNAVLDILTQQNIQHLMVEGGGDVIRSFIKTRLVDQLVLTIAPMVVGGLRSVDSLDIQTIKNIPQLENLHYQALENNLIIQGDFKWA